MQLLIDIGNTRLKWRWLRQGRLVPGGTAPVPEAGSESALFSGIWGEYEAPDRIVVSNVAGDAIRRAMDDWCQGHWRRVPEFVVAAPEQAGVVNGYRDPAVLGVDRWCGLIGARSLTSAPVAVVSCGTAITVDLLGADGRHQGGVIGPGLATMIQALTGATRGIRMEAAPEGFAAPVGRTTVECVQAGVLAAAAGMVERTLARAAFPGDGVILVTGGDADRVVLALNRSVRVEADLIFLGLARVAGEIG
jgi:type III pantothenate kinase